MIRILANRLGVVRLFSQRLSVVKLTLKSRANCSCDILSSVRIALSISQNFTDIPPHSDYSICYKELQAINLCRLVGHVNLKGFEDFIRLGLELGG